VHWHDSCAGTISTKESKWQKQAVLSATAHIVTMNCLPCHTKSGPATHLVLVDLHLRCETAYSLGKDVLEHVGMNLLQASKRCAGGIVEALQHFKLAKHT